MKVRVASVSFLEAAATGYAIGLDENGHRIEFIDDWGALSELGSVIHSTGQPQPAEVDDWQIVAVNGDVRLPLSPAALAERASFVRTALHRLDG